MASKAAIDKAYKAGHALPTVQWPADATPEQRTPGAHHCPFDPLNPAQSDERDAWLRGLLDALEAPTKDPAAIIAELKSELGGGK